MTFEKYDAIISINDNNEFEYRKNNYFKKIF